VDDPVPNRIERKGRGKVSKEPVEGVGVRDGREGFFERRRAAFAGRVFFLRGGKAAEGFQGCIVGNAALTFLLADFFDSPLKEPSARWHV